MVTRGQDHSPLFGSPSSWPQDIYTHCYEFELLDSSRLYRNGVVPNHFTTGGG